MKQKVSIRHYLLHGIIHFFLLLLIIPLAYNFFPLDKGKDTFYIPEANTEVLIHTLEIHGYNLSIIDTLFLKALESPAKGWYHITDRPTKRWNFFKNLSNFQTKTIRVKLYAGENSRELTQRLANDLKLNQQKLLKAYDAQSKYIEGDILSGFYSVSRKADEESIIHALFALSNKKLQSFSKKYPETVLHALEFKILLTIASIIQKETNNPKEMPLMASVIENRLAKGMRLQMDSTLNYGKNSHKIVSSKRIKTDKSYYNTYKYSGLPPSPLCTVSLEALESALNPSKSDYLYFMLNKKGTHDFSVSYEAHKKNIRVFRKKVSAKIKPISKDFNMTIEPKKEKI